MTLTSEVSRDRRAVATFWEPVVPAKGDALAAALLEALEGVRRIFSQTPEAFARVLRDYHMVTAKPLRARDLVIESLRANIKSGPVDPNCARLRRHLIASMGSLPQEVLRVLFLDGANHLIADEQLQEGSIQQIHLDPRSIFRRAIEHCATGLILVHNHPSGNYSPSAADLDVTCKIADMGRTLDIEIVDHIVVTSTRANSMAVRIAKGRSIEHRRDCVLRDSGISPSGGRSDELSRILDRARSLHRQRKFRRDLIGSPELFGEPAWDMLIELFIHAEGKKLSTSALCLGCTIPQSSALRLINKLCIAQLVVRIADPEDGRRHFIELAPTTAERLRSYFNAEDW